MWPYNSAPQMLGDTEGRDSVAWVEEPSLGEALMDKGMVYRMEGAGPGSSRGKGQKDVMW